MTIDVHYPIALLAIIPLLPILIIIIRKDFIKFKDRAEQKEYTKKRRLARTLIALSRVVIFLCLLTAISSPFAIKQMTIPGDYSLLMLVDNSTSFELFDQDAAPRLKNELEKQIPVKMRSIASEKRSAIGDAILNNMQGNDNILVITDGNNNYGRDLGDIMLLASILNTTIYSLDLSPVKADASVTIEGPSKVIIDTENDFFVNVDVVGNLAYQLVVTVDNQIVLDEADKISKEFVIAQKFSEGYHEMKAQIFVDDYFEENNVFYKSVKVEPRPLILFVSEKSGSPMAQILTTLYDVDLQPELPYILDDYSAIVLNDVHEKRVASKTEVLSQYLTDGNGLVVIGGSSSYEYGNYRDSVFETMLPVKVGLSELAGGGLTNIVIVIDISGSTANIVGSGVKYRVETAIASSVISGMRKDDNLGVIAFDTEAIPISYLTPLSTKPAINQTVLTVQSRFGGTNIYVGLLLAYKWLKDVEGSKNIILISDGATMDPNRALILTRAMAEEGIKLYSVGVGASTQESYMQSLAEAGNGLYFNGDDVPKLNIIFGEETAQTEKEKMQMVIINPSHFITKNIDLTGALTGYNQVVPKSNAKMLVMTLGNNPVMNVWRFGLGRVVALSTDDGGGWASVLMQKDNSKLLTRAVNWAIGDLSRRKNFDVSIKDTRLNEPTEINVLSKSSFISKDYEFSKIGEELYRAVFIPQKTGFIDVLEAKVAVNSESEYGKIGLNPELDSLVTVTGGRSFNPSEVDDIIETVKTRSKRQKTEKIDLKWIFIIMAISVFLAEIAVRRLYENRNLYKQ